MKCPSCGTENKEEAAFCMSCGENLPDTPFSQLKKEEKPPRAGAPSAAPPQAASKAAEQETTTAMPAVGDGASQAGRPADKGAAAPGTQVTSRGGFVFGGAAASPEAGGAQPAQAPPAPSTAAPGGVEKPPQQAPPKPVEAQQAPPTAAPPTGETPTAAPPPAPPEPREAAVTQPPQPATPSPPEPGYYIPPEADIIAAAPGMGAAPPAGSDAAEEAAEAEAPPIPSLESTQAVAPVAAAAAVAGRESRVVCPECYAPNPPGNAYCQECGSALPVTSARQAAARTAPGQPEQQQTAVLAPEIAAVGAAQPAYPGAVARAQAARGEKSFGVADILAVIAVGASAVAVALSFSVESFWWKKGLDIGMFSHQGAYSQGRSDLLGGPGILPYEGVEFFTIGLVVAVALALALVFLIVRVGRGPMYVLAGCILIFPIAYLFFQAILPLRQSGIDVGAAVGLRGIFFGDAANAGAGPPLWMITGAGVLLILAGFLAPPRGWGRLLTFGLCFSIILGLAFFCAACFNWNLFIRDSAAAAPAAGSLPLRELYALLL